MTAELWQQLKEAFSEVAAMPMRDREPAITGVCGGDAQLEQELRKLLDADADEGFLDDPTTVFHELLPRRKRAAPRLNAGDVLCERFQVDRFIARGGMGEVYSAYDRRVRETIALKVIRPEIAANPGAIEQFAAEVRRARAISSPQVCRVHDLFSTTDEDDRPVVFLSMQLLEGETLAQRLLRAGAFSADEALPLIRHIATALEAAHSQDIVHGDLKPSNIMLVRARDGSLRAIVTDFGLARRRVEASEDAQSSIDLFGGGGTPAYMAPEQLEGSPGSVSADIYAFGLIAFEMVTAERPFQEKDSWKEQSRRLEEPPPLVSSLAPHLPPVWDEVIVRCLQRVPEGRFPSALAVIDAFTPIAPKPGVSRRFIAGSVAALVTAGALGWHWWRSESRHVGPELPARSVAVVPFENASGNPNEKYFSDAITDEIARMVASLPGVTVIGREGSFQKERAGIGPVEIGRQLKARFVMTGTVRRANERVTILAQLVDASSGIPVFSRDYAGDVKQVTEVKERIARAVGKVLDVNLAGMQAQKPLDAMQMKAHELYWMGRFHFRKRTDDDVVASVGYFRKAIAEDGRYAPAYTGLADALSVLAERGIAPGGDGLPEAKRAAVAAMEIDDKLADAHVSLAQVTSLLDFDLDTAEKHFKRALQLDETLAPAHQWYSYLLVKERRFKEAQQHALLAHELEPHSLPMSINLAVQHFYAGDDDQTVQQCRKLSQLEPGLIFNHLLIALIFARKGLTGEAMHEMEQVRVDEVDHPLTLRAWAELYGLIGEREKGRAYVDRLVTRRAKGGVPSSYVAAAYAGIGDSENAFAWLERAYREHDAFVSLVDVYPSFASIRSDVRYEPLLRKLGLKPGMEAGSARVQ